jgi:hypothetical protein
MSQIKPAVCLDDDPTVVEPLINSIRVIGGLPVVYFRSIEAFLRFHNIKPDNREGLKKALEMYSVLVCDNNFESERKYRSQHEDGEMGGLNFLYSQIGPTILQMDERARPMVLCFAPSNVELIKNYQKYLWDTYGIISFHKQFETSLIGISVRLRRETGHLFSREQLIRNILKLPDEDTNFGTPVWELSIGLWSKYFHIRDNPKSETDIQPYNYEAKPLEWDEVVACVAEELKADPNELFKRINQEAETVRGKEGNPGQSGRKEIDI